MLDTIYKIQGKDLLFGQDARSKEWYCKELPAKNMKEAGVLMGEANKLCNEHNEKMYNKSFPEPASKPKKKKEEKPEVKGLN